MDENFRREIILDNYSDPMNRGLIEDDSYLKVNTNSESCIDNLDFMMKRYQEKKNINRINNFRCNYIWSSNSTYNKTNKCKRR